MTEEFFGYLCAGMLEYNKTFNTPPLKYRFTRQEQEILNQYVINPTPQNAKTHTVEGALIVQSHNDTFNTVLEFKNIIQNNPHLSPDEKILIEDELVVVQEPFNLKTSINSIDAQITPEQQLLFKLICFTHMSQMSILKRLEKKNALYQKELFTQIKSLKQDNRQITKDNKQITKDNKQITTIINELRDYKNEIEQQETERRERREKRRKRRRQPEKPPFLKEYISFILNNIQVQQKNRLIQDRLRIAILILIVTGVRISGILNCPLSPVVSLFNNGFIPINRLKGGREKKKAYLTPAGKALIQNFREDFLSLITQSQIVPANTQFDELNSKKFKNLYLFTSIQKEGTAPLSRPYFTDKLNKVLQSIPELKNQGIHLTSHSFRKGYITALWKDTNDIEFVRQLIGHSNIQTTSLYTTTLSDKEIKERLKNVSC